MPMADGYIVPYNLTTISQQFDGSMSNDELLTSLQHYVFSLAVQNLSESFTVKIYISKYTNDSVLIPPGNYKEIAVTTDWYRLEFIGDGSPTNADVVIIDRVETEDPDFLMTPLFPNLYQTKDFTLTRSGTNVTATNTEVSTTTFFNVTKLSAGNINYSYVDADDDTASGTLTGDIGTVTAFNNTLKTFTLTSNGSVKITVSGPVYNPINAGGYTYTPWSVSDGSSSVSASDNIVKIEYYINGNKTSTSSGNFYSNFTNEIFQTINSFYPAGYDPGENPLYDPVQFSSITSKIRTFFDSIRATSVHDQYIGGWALMTDYNKTLSLYEFTLDGSNPETSTLELPLTALGFTVQRITGTTVTFTYIDKNGDTQSSSTSSNTPLVINDSAKSITITSPDQLKVTFSGHLFKVIDFAPVVNIVYPLGFDETSGNPLSNYQSFSNALTTFQNNLTSNNFTGRVVYFKSIPFGLKEPYDLWNADYIIPEYLPKGYDLVFDSIKDEVYNWYTQSNIEKDLLKVIAWENRDIYYEDGNPEPANLTAVINNSDVHTILGQAVPEENPDLFKAKVIKNFLRSEYNGPYAMGGLNFFRYGFNL